MVVEFTGRQVEITPAVRALAERKIGKLSKVLPGITHVRIVLAADKHRQRAEVSVHSPHLDLVANEVAADAAAAVSTVIDKLTRQAERHKEKVRGGKRRASVRGTAVRPAAPAAPVAPGPRVIRSRRFVAKPMNLEQAALLVGNNGYGVLVFRDTDTRRIAVLFRRRDGNLGLIEPEA
jgi:ribosome hibernation promoting factor